MDEMSIEQMKCLGDNETCIHVYVLYNTHIHVHIDMIESYNSKHIMSINMNTFQKCIRP